MIAPNTPPTQPTNPNWFWLLFESVDRGNANWPGAVCMLPYIASGDPAPGTDPGQILADFGTNFINNLQLVWDQQVFSTVWGFYYNTSLGIQRWIATPFGTGFNGSLINGSMPAQIIALIKKTTTTWPHGRPYWRVPFVPVEFTPNGEAINILGLAAYAGLAAQLATPVVSQGITFTPASYERAANVLTPLQSAYISPGLGRMMRRGAFRNKAFGINITSLVWLF